MDGCSSLAWGSCFFQQRRLADHIGLAALAAPRAGVTRAGIAASVGAEIGFGLDEGARIGNDVDDALVKAFGRNGLGEKFGDAGVTRGHHALLLGMAG